MQHYGLVGYPLSHSFSRQYFLEKFQAEGIAADFENFAVASVTGIASLVAEHRLNGFAITIPHKKNIIPLLSGLSEAVQVIGACNCVKVEGDRLLGYNTDYVGFRNSFEPLLQPFHTKALVLGTGGAAAAVEYALLQMNIPYRNVSRTATGQQLLYAEIDEAILEEYQIIVNCSPVGTHPDIQTAPALPYEYIGPQHYLYDLVYNPAETRFLQLGKERGATVKNGYEMLVLQAEENWRIWQRNTIA
jgi:shikimate dehydrogenase